MYRVACVCVCKTQTDKGQLGQLNKLKVVAFCPTPVSSLPLHFDILVLAHTVLVLLFFSPITAGLHLHKEHTGNGGFSNTSSQLTTLPRAFNLQLVRGQRQTEIVET